MATKRLSVCVTTYKRAPQLDMTLHSLAGQTRQPDEIIISDDCSPDDTPAVVERWRSLFPRLRYNRNPVNLNMPGNLNKAVSLTTGDYVANLHDGDTYDLHLLEEWEAALNRFPTAGFVFCGIAGWPILREADSGIVLHDVAPLTTGRKFYESYFRHRFSSIVWGTVMARRTAYDGLLPFDPQFGFVSDVDMWMRMCLHYDVAYVRKPLIVLEHETSHERRPGKFNWGWLDSARRMQVINLYRFYEHQPGRLQSELRRHQFVVQQVYFRRLLGRLCRRDWIGLEEGLQLCRGLEWPIKMLGLLTHG